MRQWDNAPLEIGVFAGSFLIPPAPVLGIYKIVVESDGNELVSKTFEVQEYVLSGINVDVFPTRVPLEEHQGVDLTVSAKDVYGEPVRDRTIIRSVPITIFKSMYRVKLIKESPEFRPGYPFKATVKIEHHDGSPASSVKCLVKVISSEEHEFKRDSNDNGDIPLQLTPAVNDDVITVKVSVEDQDLLEEEIQKAAFNNTPILEIAQQSSTRINKPIKLKVICGDDVKFLIYYVIAKGTVIDQGYMRITQRNNVNIDIQYSASMVPKATVFVMTIAGDMMVYDTMDIIYDEQLNNILLEIEDIQVQPGGQVELNVRGQQGSYVALAAYDKRLQEYGSTHDISWKDMEILYDQFNGIEKNEFDILKNYGLFARVSTNIKINSAARHGGRDDSFKNPTEYRQYFAESFLWKNLSLQHSDQITLVERIPDTMTSWYITGFAVHPEYGFGIVKQPIEFTTKKSFYIVDHLPHSIKRGEEVELQFTIFNGNKDAEVNVQLLNVFDQLDFVGELSSESGQIKSVVTQPNVGASVSFHVKAKKLGEIVVRVVASNMHDRDAIEKVVRVMPESLMNRGSESRLFQSTSYMNQSFKMSPKIHRHADADSTKITFKLERKMLLPY
ncbi:hypothetical protein ZHAS_00004704 [Anopheles sinensis]|uniref:Alpha-2-macroglobulin bait region domain-containing protein n=1 Tax=Anopheles sinensis TaxID=74873 RepID=A0A084VHN9_ANOSI|nr:hypothetical protein ZHAS_00004704 [Anopheles sinensis]